MKNYISYYICCASLLFLIFFISPAFGIGKGHRGVVTQSPWQGTYTYIQIDDVLYTVMESAVVKRWYTANGVDFHDTASLKNIRTTDTVRFVSEGNRIYLIEIIE